MPFHVSGAGKLERTAIEHRRVGLIRHGLQLRIGLLVHHPGLTHRAVLIEPEEIVEEEPEPEPEPEEIVEVDPTG